MQARDSLQRSEADTQVTEAPGALGADPIFGMFMEESIVDVTEGDVNG